MTLRAPAQEINAVVTVPALLLIAATSAANAQGPDPSGRKVARVAPIAAAAPRIDGLLTDDAWIRSTFITDFVAKEPVEGAAPSVVTRVAFAYDDDALYVGARMEAAPGEDVGVVVTRRDNYSGVEEILIVALDTYLDRRTAFSFAITTAGTRIDYYHATDAEFSRDYAFNPVWDGAVVVDSTGWSAEMRIPFSQLRFNDRPEQVWGLNVNRYIPARNEDLFWVMIPKNETGFSSRFGDLRGIRAVRPSRRIEVLPYGASNATVAGAWDPADPFHDRTRFDGRVGGDLKMGLGPSLTLDATVNPDFGQVGADPAEVNLSAFPTFFSERRPFFDEGGDLLRNTGTEGYFYSRRIGAPPRGSAAGDFIDRPLNSTILGAAKLTGRVGPDLAIAAVAAVTDQEEASTYSLASGATSRVRVEPLTAYGALRLVRRFGAAGSTAGFMVTGVERDVPDGTPLAGVLNRRAYAGGTDWIVRFAGGRYETRWLLGFSHVAGDPGAIERVQRHSAHFFQRPDAEEVRLDPTRRTMTGMAFSWRVEKLGGRHWLWNIWGEMETPDFEINDQGRLMGANDIDFHGALRYRENQPGPVFYNYEFNLSSRHGFNFGGRRQFSIVVLSVPVTWRNYWTAELETSTSFSATSDALTRGGPLMKTPRTTFYTASLGSNSRARTRWTLDATYQNDDLGGSGYRLTTSLGLRPGGRWELSARPTYQRLTDPRQYLTTRSGGPVATYGQRYIFSFIERSTLSAQLRANFAIQPDMTLEVYAEPFAASGRYYDVGELAASGGRDLRVYGAAPGTSGVRAADGDLLVTDGADAFTIANPDFSTLSFRSNVVIRWEWRPGSTLFLVWQQTRGRTDSYGDLVGPARLWDAVRATGDNFLALKVTYWLSVS